MKTFISFLLALWATVVIFFKKRHHLLTVPVAVLAFAGIVPLLRWADPTAAVFDFGIFQIPIFVSILFFYFLTVAWFTLRFVFGNFYRYLIFDLKTDFKGFEPWKKAILSYFIYFLLFASLVLLTIKVA